MAGDGGPPVGGGAVGTAVAPVKKTVSAFVGRPREIRSSRRYVTTQRDRSQLRLWRAAPEAVSYLADVVRGKALFDEGKFKSATAILSRCLPTLTAQQVDSTNVTTTIGADGLMASLAQRARALESHFGRPLPALLAELGGEESDRGGVH